MACWTRRKAVTTQLYRALAETLRPATEQLVDAWREHDPQNLTAVSDVGWAYQMVLHELEAKIDPTIPDEPRLPLSDSKEAVSLAAMTLIDQLTATLQGREKASRSAKTKGVIAVEFALHRAEQQWCRLEIVFQSAQVAAGVATRHGLTTKEARGLADAIGAGLQTAGEDKEAGRQWLKAMRAYAISAAREAAE